MPLFVAVVPPRMVYVGGTTQKISARFARSNTCTPHSQNCGAAPGFIEMSMLYGTVLAIFVFPVSSVFLLPVVFMKWPHNIFLSYATIWSTTAQSVNKTEINRCYFCFTSDSCTW